MRIIRKIMLWLRSESRTSPDDERRQVRVRNEAIERMEQEKLKIYFMYGRF